MSSSKPAPTPTRTISAGAKAGRLYERIVALRVERDAEIARAPESIRERYLERERKVFEAAGEDVTELARRMLGDAD